MFSPGCNCLRRSYCVPGSRNGASAQQRQSGDREPKGPANTGSHFCLHWPSIPLPYKIFSLHLTPFQPSLPLSVYLLTMSLKSSHTCFHFSIWSTVYTPVTSETVLSALFSHLLITRFSLYFIDVFETVIDVFKLLATQLHVDLHGNGLSGSPLTSLAAFSKSLLPVLYIWLFWAGWCRVWKPNNSLPKVHWNNQ